jgi:hypothetical protein
LVEGKNPSGQQRKHPGGVGPLTPRTPMPAEHQPAFSNSPLIIGTNGPQYIQPGVRLKDENGRILTIFVTAISRRLISSIGRKRSGRYILPNVSIHGVFPARA